MATKRCMFFPGMMWPNHSYKQTGRERVSSSNIIIPHIVLYEEKPINPCVSLVDLRRSSVERVFWIEMNLSFDRQVTSRLSYSNRRKKISKNESKFFFSVNPRYLICLNLSPPGSLEEKAPSRKLRAPLPRRRSPPPDIPRSRKLRGKVR